MQQGRAPTSPQIFKDWVLPAAIERIRRKLAGPDDGDRQMVDILEALFAPSEPTVR